MCGEWLGIKTARAGKEAIAGRGTVLVSKSCETPAFPHPFFPLTSSHKKNMVKQTTKPNPERSGDGKPQFYCCC